MKKRHIKTFEEKYHGDVRFDIDLHFKEKRRLDDSDVFNTAPYIGIAYKDVVKYKITCVNNSEAYYIYYDDHHKCIYKGSFKYTDFYLDGNVIREHPISSQ